MIRKITTRQDEEKRRRKNQIIVGVILVFLMLLSTLGYSFGTNLSQQNQKGAILNYNGYEFSYISGLWSLNIGGTIFSFVNNPNDAYKTDSQVNSLTIYYGKPLYIYSENLDGESEIYRNLFTISQGVINACLENENCTDAGLPVKTCEDNFIIIKEADETKIEQIDGCIFMEGPASELTKIADGFLLKIIGVN